MSFLISRSLIHTGRAVLTRQVSTKVSITTAAAKEKWDLYAGVLVERLPVITKTMAPIEVKFKVWFDPFYIPALSADNISYASILGNARPN